MSKKDLCVVGVGVAMLVGALFVALRMGSVQPEPCVPSPTTTSEEPLPRLSELRVQEVRSSLLTSMPELGAASTKSDSEDPGIEPQVHIHGRLLDLTGLLDLDGADVELQVPGEARQLSARTDREGRFEIKLQEGDAAIGALVKATAKTSSGRTVFMGSVLVEGELNLMLRSPLELDGVLSFRPHELVGEPGQLQVLGHLQMEASNPLFLGTAPVAEDGRFHLSAAIDRDLTALEFRWFAEAGGSSDRSTIVNALLRDVKLPRSGSEPLRLEADLAIIHVHARESDGRPVGGATVLARQATGGIAQASTNEGGDATLLVTAGTWRLALTGRGFAPYAFSDLVVSRGDSLDVPATLERAPELLEVSGLVVDPLGNPVEGAYVRINPFIQGAEGLEPLVDAGTGIHTEADGSFRLETPLSPLLITAFDRDLRSTQEIVVQPPMKGIVLRFLPLATLELELQPPPESDGWTQSGPIDILLVERTGAFSLQDRTFTVPYNIAQIPPGSYNLYVFAAPWDGYAHGTVDVHDGSDQSVRLQLEPCRWLDGTVRSRHEGSPVVGARISHTPPEWPSQLSRSWGMARTGTDGRFHILTATAKGGPLVVERDGGRSWEGMAAPGQELRIELEPER